jgi:hypothetical protein
LIDAADQPTQAVSRHRHPFRHHPQRLALDQPAPDRIEVVVQFWLRPGEAAVTLGPGEERREERIPEQLRRFL